METENDNTIPFLDTLVIKDSEGRLTTSVYRKTTHTDQYLSCDSHHPQSVKHGVVKCLYDRSKNIITKPSVISEEKKHLSSVLVSNEYPCSFVANVTKSKNQPISSKHPTTEIKSTAVPPYLKGLSKQLRRCLQKHGIRSVFKSDTTQTFKKVLRRTSRDFVASGRPLRGQKRLAPLANRSTCSKSRYNTNITLSAT